MTGWLNSQMKYWKGGCSNRLEHGRGVVPARGNVLRLRNAYPPVSLDEARVKQMHVRLKNRLRRKLRMMSNHFGKNGSALTPTHGTFIMLGVFLVLVLVLWTKRRK
jgi:hypothetical protein